MAQTLPYLSSNKNVGELFKRIHAAQKPETFTQAYLRDTLGLKGSNDRPLIPFLRNMGFIDGGGRPTPAYDLLKNQNEAKAAIADGIRRAYAPLFSANENANALPSDQLKGLVSQVAGTDEDKTARIAATFGTTVKLGDFSKKHVSVPREVVEEEESTRDEEDDAHKRHQQGRGGLRPDFHYNIQIHLPPNGTEETYVNIFNAIRRTFK